jgi:stearoyl-CoA desaturase (delta-9 desaturase)
MNSTCEIADFEATGGLPATQALPPAEARENAHYSQAEGFWAELGGLPQTLYWSMHAACLLGFVYTPGARELALFGACYALRIFAITGGYHRYFAHRSYRTSRAFQFVLAALGASAVQKGPLWWASRHRQHHKYADQPGKDIHSPREGFYHAHQGWIFNGRHDASLLDQIRDFASYPELVWLNRWHVAPPLAIAAICAAIGGIPGLVWGFLISTLVCWHSTYTINSLAHRWGSRRYATRDDSRNNLWLALLTFGEGWHNNHHHFCASARQGFFWWEIDVTYYLLRALAALGLVWDLREPPAHVVRASVGR